MYQNDASCFNMHSLSLCLFIWELSPLILRDINHQILLLAVILILLVVVMVMEVVVVVCVCIPLFFCIIFRIFCLFVDIYIFLSLEFPSSVFCSAVCRQILVKFGFDLRHLAFFLNSVN